MVLYPDTFKPERKEHFQGWLDRYKAAIGNNWDYDKLMYFFDTHYKSTTIPPHPSFFKEFKSEVVIQKPKPKPVEMSVEEKEKADIAFKKIKQEMMNFFDKHSMN